MCRRFMEMVKRSQKISLLFRAHKNAVKTDSFFTAFLLCLFYFKRFINTMRMEAFRKSTTKAPIKGMTK